MKDLYNAILSMFKEFTYAITGVGKLAHTATRTTQNIADVVENMSIETKLTKEIFAQMRLDTIAQYKESQSTDEPMTQEQLQTKLKEINKSEEALGE